MLYKIYKWFSERNLSYNWNLHSIAIPYKATFERKCIFKIPFEQFYENLLLISLKDVFFFIESQWILKLINQYNTPIINSNIKILEKEYLIKNICIIQFILQYTCLRCSILFNDCSHLTCTLVNNFKLNKIRLSYIIYPRKIF